MIIEIKGVEFENKGAELMLHGILQRIRLYWPHSEIALTPGPNAPYLMRSNVNAWQKLSLRKSIIDLNFLAYFLPGFIKKSFKKWGIVTEADINVIFDASGFSYSDQWGGDLRMRHAAAEAKRMKRKGMGYIFMPQAMGPFNRDSTKKIIKQGFPHASLVCARDDDTYRHLKKAGGNFESLRQYKDFTNAVDGVTPTYFLNGDSKLCIVPNKNMINPRNKNKEWIGSYIKTLAFFARTAKEHGLEVFFLNHEGPEDESVINEVNSLLDKKADIIRESDPLKVKGIIQSSRLSICSRYHGCISALSSGKACVGTSWSHKYERLYEEYECGELLVGPGMDESDLRSIFLKALDENSKVISDIQRNAKKFKEETEVFWSEIKEVVDEISKN